MAFSHERPGSSLPEPMQIRLDARTWIADWIAIPECSGKGRRRRNTVLRDWIQWHSTTCV